VGIVAVDGPEGSLIRQISMGDVVYDISVKRFSEGMHRAIWTCSACKEEGAWAPISADPEQAFQSAIVGLEVHHNFVHGPSKTNPPHTRRPFDQLSDTID
jgi:hypothetical protein